MGKWGKWVLCFAIAMALGTPVSAVDLTLGGKYEIHGRYYKEKDIREAKVDDTTSVTAMYLKHYFNLYPTITVNENIKIIGDLESFDNVISKNDSRQWYDKSSAAATYATDDNGSDPYDNFTINELYVDALTPVGKFMVGKTKLYNGIAWFIQTPQTPDWTFGLVWNKRDENANKNSYIDIDGNSGGTSTDAYSGTTVDGSDLIGVVTNHDNADVDEYTLVANYLTDAIDFKGYLHYRKGGHSGLEAAVYYPHLYFDYTVNKDLKFNSMVGFAGGPLVPKDSNPAKGMIAYFDDTALTAGGFGGNLAAAGITEFEEDLEVKGAHAIWVGVAYTMDALKIKGDAVYLSGADKPTEVSSYLEDYENLDTWLMQDQADAFSTKIQTPATLLAHCGSSSRYGTAYGSDLDGKMAYTNATMLRLNLAYTFTPKLNANLNLVYAMMTDTGYLENWNTSSDLYRTLAVAFPNSMKVGGTGLLGGFIAAPTQKYDVDDDMGWEARARINYKLIDNLVVGLDLCYFAPGKLYEDLIENAFTPGYDTGYDMKDEYAARWTAKITF